MSNPPTLAARLAAEWWWPQTTDAAWCAEMRAEYDDAADMTDDEIRDQYADGRKYAVAWDHTGEAYEQFEAVMDALAADPPGATVERVCACGHEEAHHNIRGCVHASEPLSGYCRTFTPTTARVSYTRALTEEERTR